MTSAREKMIETAEKLFLRYGIRSVKMDDVAKELAISKKTLYQLFKDKDELVKESTREHIKREQTEFDRIYAEASNSIEELFLVSKCLRQMLNEVNPTMLFDLKRFYPDAWQQWVSFRDGYLFDSLITNLKKGINDGHFRAEINPEILAILRIQEVQMLFEDFFPTNKFDYRDVQMHLFDHFVHGLLTEKGRHLYHSYLEQETNESYVHDSR